MDLSELERKIDYTFNDRELVRTALTHSSYANESHGRFKHNERLEFLGDSVLGCVTAEYLFKNYPDLPEGELTKMRAARVCEKALHGYAESIGLGSFLRMGKGEALSGGRHRPSIEADAFEALIAAIYLDGGFEKAKSFVLGFISNYAEEPASGGDYKSLLQEIIQRNHSETLDYRLVAESGPDHNKEFTVEVMLNTNVIATGVGRSKKKAEQAAAHEALKLMGVGE